MARNMWRAKAIRWLALLAALLPAVSAQAAAFDYWLLSLSWSPQYCAETRRAEGEPQCARPYGFVVHGLWPQYQRGGWPKDCDSRERVPEATIERLLPLMPSRALIIHEWREHGACSGLGADAYFRTIEQVRSALRIPQRFQQLAEPLTLDPVELKQSLMRNNPGIPASGIVVQCSGRYLQEVRICLGRDDFGPQACGKGVRDRCGASAVMRPVRGG